MQAFTLLDRGVPMGRVAEGSPGLVGALWRSRDEAAEVLMLKGTYGSSQRASAIARRCHQLPRSRRLHTSDGRRTRYGRVFRSNSLQELTPADLKMIRERQG